MRFKSMLFATVIPALALAANMAAAGPVPVSYTMSQSPTLANGNDAYADNGGRQLIDGQLGRAGVSVDLGHGSAQEWVAWRTHSDINLEFSFAGPAAITGVHVGSSQVGGASGNILMPSFEVAQWLQGTWQFVGSVGAAYNPAYEALSSSLAPHPFVNLAGLNFTSDKVRVTLKPNPNGNWTFVDEVLFDGPAATVPEPGGLALLGLGLGMLGLARRRRA